MLNASRAASGGNTQPWHLYFVTGDKKEELTNAALMHVQSRGKPPKTKDYNVYPTDATPGFTKEVKSRYMDRRMKCATGLWDLMGVKREDKAGRAMALSKNFRFWDAPIAIMVTVDRCADKNGWGHTGMLLDTIALLAEERGLAVCMLEAWADEIVGNAAYEALSIDREKEAIWCGMGLGYPDKEAKINTLRTDRLPVSEFR